MKKHGNTNVPRKEELNKALVSLGHKVHNAGRSMKIEKDKQKKMEEELWDKHI